MDLGGVAQALSRGRATIATWIGVYCQEGLESLLRRRHVGRGAKVTDADREALQEGLRQGKWKTAKEIQRWLKRERGIELTVWGVYYWLYQLQGSWKVPRKSHTKNSGEVEEFQHELVSKLERWEVPAERAVHIWLEDEHRYGLIGVVRRCWTVKGYRPTAPYQAKYQWGYIYGAADVVTGEAEFLYTPTVSFK
jgi:transposase